MHACMRDERVPPGGGDLSVERLGIELSRARGESAQLRELLAHKDSTIFKLCREVAVLTKSEACLREELRTREPASAESPPPSPSPSPSPPPPPPAGWMRKGFSSGAGSDPKARKGSTKVLVGLKPTVAANTVAAVQRKRRHSSTSSDHGRHMASLCGGEENAAALARSVAAVAARLKEHCPEEFSGL